ncbi:MAG: winged helix-turn-helix transcriptional regulator [Chloroflexi bacterium]|nr:winged helix-turn-helix transcriptional regulator [Chloroflexota bacterium]
MRIADLELDPDWHAVSRGGRQITLTRIQFQLLALLAKHVNQVVGYDELVAEAWGHADEQSPSSLVKSHISRLRRKLGLARLGPLVIKASPGQGYMLRLRATS